MSATQFTKREEDLQKLLAEERNRSEQRRQNYNELKTEHLKLQESYLRLQSEMKQILDETVYFKEKKNIELDELLKNNENKDRELERIKKILADNDPEHIRIKLSEDFDQSLKKIEKEKDRIVGEKDRLHNELRLLRQQMEHQEKEHLDSIEKVKLSYEVELNLVRREKEEIRSRLVEASQVPDVKKLIDLSEDNSRLNRKLQQSHEMIEQTGEQFKLLQKQIEDLLIENDQKDRINQNKLCSFQEKINEFRNENKQLKTTIAEKQQENEELTKEIQRLKRSQEKIRFDLEQQRIFFDGEKEAISAKLQQEIQQSKQINDSLKNEIKKLSTMIENKDESLALLERKLESKEREFNDRISLLMEEEAEKHQKIESEKHSIENLLRNSNNEKSMQEAEIEKLRKQLETFNELKIIKEREQILLQAKLDSQSVSIEELEKIRRQHLILHDELNRIRMESFDLLANNKELLRMNRNLKDENERLRKQFEEEHRHLEELNLTNEKNLSKLFDRFEEERRKMLLQSQRLERENQRLREVGINQIQHESRIQSNRRISNGFGDHTARFYGIRASDYSRFKARQYSKLADCLNSIIDQLKINENGIDNNDDEQDENDDGKKR